MLQVEGLDVRYGTTHAVRAVDLAVGSGDALAVLGPNGAGKTSTLRAVSGLVPHGGTVRFDGEDVTRLPAEEIARRGLIHVPEGRHVFPDLTVEENLGIGATAQGGRRSEFGIDDVHDLFPALGGLRRRLGFALSGGEQQMVALGRALMGGPRLLLVDEPSLGLSPRLARSVTAALAEIRARVPLVVVEQNVQLALRICPRAAVMVRGEIVLRASRDELDDRDALLASYLGQQDARAT
ncbi:MAG TPA: ABC transporter ATP-binding protein [Acidimicrobiales bacterium]